MIPDSNSIVQLAGNSIIGMSGDLMLFGLIMFLVIAFVLIQGRARAGASMMVAVMLALALSIFIGAFMIVFWLAIVGSLLVLIIALKRRLTTNF